MNRILEISRRHHGQTRIVTDDTPPLADGDIRLRVDRVAVTANTVTYATAGDLLGYWDFYPSGDDGWGRTPAMGWAEVVESNHPDIATGGRYYGWYPMAQFVDITATPTSTGLRDDGEHRSNHAPVYRAFEHAERDPLFATGTDATDIDDLEDRHSLLRGLFLTGYLAAAFFDVNGWHGARDAVVLSASSKTAVAFATAARDLGAVRLVGVTSAGNRTFVEKLGRYDRVLTYDQVANGDHDLDRVVVVDMAGNQRIVAALHEQLGDRIGYSMTIGLTHHDQPPATVTGGPEPQLFFAPTAISEMNAAGADTATLQLDAAAALGRFIESSHEWLNIERVDGGDAAQSTWSAAHDGTLDPDVGRIVSLHATTAHT